MNGITKKEALFLGVGDIVVMAVSLLLALVFRSGEIPSANLFAGHIPPFTVVFLYSIIVFYILGLYDRYTSTSKNRIPARILQSQLVNVLIAIALFYFIPFFSVTPKLNLFIYIVVSTIALVLWRLFLFPKVGVNKVRAVVIGTGHEFKNIVTELSSESAGKSVVSFDLNSLSVEDIKKGIAAVDPKVISYVIVDSAHPKASPILPDVYQQFIGKVEIIDLYAVYEDIFSLIPLSHIEYPWLLRNIASISAVSYDAVKRITDILLALPVGLITIISLPFVATILKIQDGGDVFIRQNRIGKGGKIIKMIKYRSMQRNDGGKWLPDNKENKVTKFGYFLRKSRLDEFPQAWNVLKGDLSIIGPRPDIVDLGVKLAEAVPYYTLRTIVKPGLSGWAQVNQEKPPQSLEETKIRLSYDLFYIKNRSLFLDLKITLKTIKTLLSFVGM